MLAREILRGISCLAVKREQTESAKVEPSSAIQTSAPMANLNSLGSLFCGKETARKTCRIIPFAAEVSL